MIACIIRSHGQKNRIVQAFAQGCSGQMVQARDFLARPRQYSGVMTFGMAGGDGDCLRAAMREGMDFYHGDNAYLVRTPSFDIAPLVDQHWLRLTKNRTQAAYRHWDTSPRLKNLIALTKMNRWRDAKIKTALLCEASGGLVAFAGPCVRDWERRIAVKLHSLGYNVRVRGKKDRPSLVETIESGSVGLVATYTSVAAVEALMAGVPVVTSEASICHAFSCDPALPEKPEPNRKDLLNLIVNSQFTVREMREGVAWRILNEKPA